MTPLPPFPKAVHRYVGVVFAAVNRRVAEKIARVPNCSEPSLDLTFVEQLTQYAGPRVVAPGWAVRIDVHYLGGLRHFYRWEIADIGVLVFARQGKKTIANKVALLQSKRLYPNNGNVVEETREDFQIGFGNLLPSASGLPSIALSHTYQFTDKSKYGALQVDDQQYKAIADYEAKHALPVHYLLYNPWVVPASYSYPITGPVKLGHMGNGGCRVVPSKDLRASLAGKAKGYSPAFADIDGLVSKSNVNRHGWRLEYFMSSLLMKCREGSLFESINQENMYALFNRRSGPIAAAVAVTVEQFGDQHAH